MTVDHNVVKEIVFVSEIYFKFMEFGAQLLETEIDGHVFRFEFVIVVRYG
jgi:hypothetical protein